MQTCAECSSPFRVSDGELEIVRKVFSPEFPLPPIKKCPDCRMRQRLAFRNERKLYRRSCDLTGKQIISVYRPDAPVVVYDQSVWWGEQYDPLEFGQEIDFTRPFFEQFAELHARVPKLSIHNSKSENCEYTNYSSENRNCYLAVGALGAEDCLYSYRVFYSKNIVDCFGLSRSELCYECSQGADLYRCIHTINCQSSSDLFLCADCVGCRDCFGCSNLRNRQYCIFNEQLTADEYGKRVAALRRDPGVYAAFDRFVAERPERASYVLNCEDASGDQIRNCRRCHDVYFLYDSEDVVHARNGENNRDCADLNFGDNCELQYQASNLEKNYRVGYAVLAWYVSESFYVLSSFNSRKLFGCCGMKKHEYCILNRKYSASEYEALVPKLVNHMVETGEWGAFFPAAMSPFLFAESVAQELLPLPAAELARRMFNLGEPPATPESATTALHCQSCSRPFRVIPQEQRFYDALALPAPTVCPDCRHRARIARRRPMKLQRGSCHDCNCAIATTAPGSALCDSCFTARAG